MKTENEKFSQTIILRLPAVKSASGLSRSSLYNRIAQGLWPKPISLGARAVGWPMSEVAAINAARIAGKSNEEIRQLVVRLEIIRNDAPSEG
jgi:prophage regulatory protein